MIQLSKTGLIADRADIDRLREEFRLKHVVRLQRFLEPAFFALAQRSLAQGEWQAHTSGFDAEEILAPGPTVDLLHFVANWPKVLELAGDITGCGPFKWFGGRVYRMRPGAGHYDDWHTDDTDRLVAMSINLSPRGYEGGLFQMRARGGTQLLAELANTGPGDTTLFRLSDDLLHRVTEVLPGDAKIAFAGWFDATAPSLSEQLHRRLE